jgi:hypothetical protein
MELLTFWGRGILEGSNRSIAWDYVGSKLLPLQSEDEIIYLAALGMKSHVRIRVLLLMD